MSVFYNLEIAPNSNHSVSLQEIKEFILNLSENGLIEKEITILTGEHNDVQNISFWDFQNLSLSSGLTSESKLQIVEEKNIEDLSAEKNYAFKVHLTKKSDVFKNLNVFTATDLEHFPLFISYLAKPFDSVIFRGDEEEEDFEMINISNINCILKSSGRNSQSLWGLGENPASYEAFYKTVAQLLGEYEIGIFVD